MLVASITVFDVLRTGPNQWQSLCFTAGLFVKRKKSLVYGVFGHFAIGRKFSTCHRDHSRFCCGNFVSSRKIGRSRIDFFTTHTFDERSEPRPNSSDVVASDIGGDRGIECFKYIINVCTGALRVIN